MDVQYRIRKTRKEKGLTQEELAERMGVTQSMVGQYETNKQPPKLDTLKKIAKALDVPENYLLIGEEDFVAGPVVLSSITHGSARITTDAEKQIMECFELLNLEGRREALKRIRELTLLDEYRK